MSNDRASAAAGIRRTGLDFGDDHRRHDTVARERDRLPLRHQAHAFKLGAVDFFGDEGTSETARYENVGHFTYSSRTDLPEMVKDIDWVWKTVDGYAASWQEDDGGEVDDSTGGASTVVGIALQAALAAGDIIEMMPAPQYAQA